MAGKGAVGTLSGFIVFIVAVMGVAGWWSNEPLENYHNEFVQGAYKDIITGAWNDLGREINSDDVSDDRVAALLEQSLVPRCKKWLAEADKLTPPAFAASFHGRYRSGIEVLAKDAEKLTDAIHRHDRERVLAIFKHMSPAADRLNQEVLQLQESLKTERKFTIEENTRRS